MILPEKNTIGIYKITNPKGRVYIGQSMCIRSRWILYKNYHCKAQSMLYRSFNKHGVENHTFEILTTCNESELNDLERYYQDVYNVLDRKCGLNLRLTETSNKSGKLSDETKLKISLMKKGIKHTNESRIKMSKAKKGLYIGSENPAAREIIVKNLDTLEVFKGSMECVAKHIGCNVEYVWSQVDELTKATRQYREWIFMDKNKHHDFLDIKCDVYLDLYTGIYHFYESEMMLPTKYSKHDRLERRLKRTDRYIKV